MEIMATKSKDLTGTSTPSAKGEGVNSSLGGFAETFTELTRKLGTRMESDPSAMAAHTVLGAIYDRAEPASPPERNQYERRDDLAGSQAQDRNRSAPQREDRFDDRRVEYGSDSGREQAVDQGANGAGDAAVQRPRRDDAPRENRQAANDGGGDGGGARRPADAAGGDRPDGGEAPAATASSEPGQAASTATGEAVQSQALSGQQSAEQMLSGVIGMVQTSELPGQMAANAGNRAVEASVRDEPLREISAALAAPGRRVSAVGTGTHQSGAQGQPARANANVQGQAQAEAAAMADNGAARQAATLSRMVGEGNRVAVGVGAAAEAASIVSKPTATVTAATVLAAESANKKGTGQPARPGNAAPGTLAQNAQSAQVAQQAAAAQAQAQAQAQQNAAQTAQTQAVAANATEAKATGPAGVHANAGAQQAQAGGEATAQTNTATAGETNQAQKSAAAQAATPHKQATFRQAMVDQVTVQITAAARAGIDKINIQLKPASLGRIDVQLEVAMDGRVSAVITADNKDTLEMLQRDAKDLARALQDAGLQADAENMEFNLREQNRQAPEKGPDGPATGAEQVLPSEIADEDLNAVMAAGYRGGIDADGHVDIHA